MGCNSSVAGNDAWSESSATVTPRDRSLLHRFKSRIFDKVSHHPTQPQSSPRTPRSEHAVLLEQIDLLQFQLNGLERLNAQTEHEFQKYVAASSLPGVPICENSWNDEMIALETELMKRGAVIAERIWMIEALRHHLQKHGLSLDLPAEARSLALVPEDDSQCQYCISAPIQTEFPCCGHRAACLTCAAKMRQSDPRCPHCRAPSDYVKVHGAYSPPSATGPKASKHEHRPMGVPQLRDLQVLRPSP